MDDFNITSAQYYRDADDTENLGVLATIDGKSLHVPLDTANRHYQAILDWVDEGNTIQDCLVVSVGCV